MGIGIYRNYIDDFPPDLKEDSDWQSFASLLDSLDLSIISSITTMKYFWDLEKCPSNMLKYLGYVVGAQINGQDSERIKRQKIRDAMYWNRNKGTIAMMKFWIQRITGIEPEFAGDGSLGYLAIWESLNNLLSFPNDFMKWESLNNIDPLEFGGFKWGSLSNSGYYERFIIYINTRCNDLTLLELDSIEKVIIYGGAVYIRYHIGYEDNGWHLYRTVY